LFGGTDAAISVDPVLSSSGGVTAIVTNLSASPVTAFLISTTQFDQAGKRKAEYFFYATPR
jgi:hypothetical protein